MFGQQLAPVERSTFWPCVAVTGGTSCFLDVLSFESDGVDPRQVVLPCSEVSDHVGELVELPE